ncbi:MAG: tyrosine-type recombinase/integrase [Candidatus Paracaedibacter sp.]
MPKLTKRFVESLIPDPQKPLKFWDDELRRFGVIILPSGRRTYCIEYRNADRIQKRVKIGVHGQITPEQARNLARIKLGQVAYGEDIAQTSKQMRNLPTLTELADEYVNRHGQRKRPKSLTEDQRLLRNHILPALGNMKVANISHQDIEKLHTSFGERPYQANRVVALLSKMFSLAITWGLREDNPTRGIQKYQEEKRDRWLNEEELQRLWSVLDSYPKHITAYFIKFLILTGARKGETLQATWDQFDLAKGIWRKPSHLTKQKKTEYLPLSDKALSILKETKKLIGKPQYVFPGHIEDQPMKEPKRFWTTVTKAAELENIRIHDLRHTHASHLVSSGLSLSIVGKLLGHTQAATTQRYAHLADAPLRQAAELFSSKVGK